MNIIENRWKKKKQAEKIISGQRAGKDIGYVQLQKCQIGQAVVCPVFALELYIILEYRHCLRVVTIQPAEDIFNVLWPRVERQRCGRRLHHHRSRHVGLPEGRGEGREVYEGRWIGRAAKGGDGDGGVVGEGCGIGQRGCLKPHDPQLGGW